MHGDSLQAFGTVDFLSGSAQSAKGLSRREIMKYVHGALCILGFGIVMLLGVLMARYKGFLSSGAPALWFKIHMCCQVSASIIGIIGFILGIVVGHKSQMAHMIIGIVIGLCTSLQIISACLRPHKGNNTRPIWNACHYVLGYGVVGLSAANIFLGWGLLGRVPKWWTQSYMAYLIVFGLAWILSFPLNWLRSKTTISAPEEHA